MPYSILIVDDEPDNFDTIEALLAKFNYTLNYAHSGEQAIDMLEAFVPDAILLDVMMPGIDGIETCRRIKAMPQWQMVPIIMVTALTETADLARCLSAGADDFISKPLNKVELRARVQSMLRIKKQHDRIQSLSKLQRNNIHFLENSLHELHLDLAVSFPHELKDPLQQLISNARLLQNRFDRLNSDEVAANLAIVNDSALKLDRSIQSFLFYLQLALPSKNTKQLETCQAQAEIEQTLSMELGLLPTPLYLKFDLENAELMVTSAHIRYIVSALFDRLNHRVKPGKTVYIQGKVIDNAYHFCIDSRASASGNALDSKLSELIRINAVADDDINLGIGLKIVKKIIEIYDGIFLQLDTLIDDIVLYITLPLFVRK